MAENPAVCGFAEGEHQVREERQEVTKVSRHFKCIGRGGNFFLANPLAFSVAAGSRFSAFSFSS
jgi:hypothetical protein